LQLHEEKPMSTPKKPKAITLSEISVASVGRAIKQLDTAFNNNSGKITVIQSTIMVGYEQASNFDTEGNAYCQKAGALASAVAKFSPDRAKKVVAFFKGKIPFSIVSNGEGGYKLSKLNWDLIKAPEVLQAEHDTRVEDAKTRAAKRKADNAETVAKAKKADMLQEQVKELKLKALENTDTALTEQVKAEQAKAEQAKAEQAKAVKALTEQAKAAKAAEKSLIDARDKVVADYQTLQVAYTKALAEIAILQGQLKEARRPKE
jgi:hypothetical protein